MQTHWMMRANADQFDQSTTIISRNFPNFPKILIEEMARNMSIQLQHIWWNYSLFFSSSITPRVLCIQLYEPSNNNYIYQILYRFYTIIQTYHKKRKRNPYLQHLIMWWFNRSVHLPCVCCIPTNSIKVSTTMCLLHPYKQYKGKHYNLGLQNLALTLILSCAILFQCIQVAQRLLKEYNEVIALALCFIHTFQPSSNTIMT